MLDPVGVDLLDLVHVQVELGSLPKKQKKPHYFSTVF